MEPVANTDRWQAGRILDIVPFALTVLCAGVLSFLSGGYIFARSAPTAIVYLLTAAVWVWILRRRSRPSALYLTALAVFGLFVAWAGLSVLWSFGPDRTWMAFDVAALYLAVLAVVGLTPAGSIQLRVTVFGFLVVSVAVGIYALLGKVTPDIVTHAHTYARLDNPIGYWNVLALMMVLGLVVTLALAGDRAAHPLWRVLAAAAGVPLSLTFFFALSRGGWIALAVALLVYFAFSTSRLASFISLVAIAVPSAAAVWQVRGLSTLFTATTNDALRTAQGHALLRWALAALAVTVCVQLLVSLAHSYVPWPRWSHLAAGAAVLVVLVTVVSAGSWMYLEPRGGSAWIKDRIHTYIAGDDTTSADEGASRLVSMNTGRPPLWREALRQSRSGGALGTGAGTFVFTHERFREAGDVVKHAHSQWFNVLSELGTVGLGLFVAAVVLILAAAFRNPFADRKDPLRPFVVAMQAGLVAFVVHISWDWDWDMAAIGVVFFLFAATCATYLGTRRERAKPTDATDGRRTAAMWPLRAGASALLVLLAVSWLFPYLSSRAQSDAATAVSKGDVAAALADVRRAARWDPLAVDPLLMQSLLLQQVGRNGEALATLRSAERLQPDNYEPYYEEGVLLLTAFDDRKAAVEALKHALALSPLDGAARYELEQAVGH